MADVLTIDEGNTSTKIALWRNGVKEAVAVCTSADRNEVGRKLGISEPVGKAIICSVRGGYGSYDDLAREVMLLTSSTPMPIKVGYRSPATLGADRIAAAAGAATIAPGKTCLIVDMGTAVTYDLLTAEGEYVGGNIAPGIFMRLEALHRFTKALPSVETIGDCPSWGYDTQTAMRSGAIRGVVGELEHYIRTASCDADPVVILTGGAANLVLPYLEYPIIHEPDLVLMGLNSIINYNEAK